jgi:general secretion pathway protein F
MTTFVYTGQHKQTGKKVKGRIDADSVRDARNKLQKMNLFVLDLRQTDTAAAARSNASLWTKLNRRPPRQEDIAFATKQFAILAKAGVDFNEALRSVSEQVENDELRSVYAKIRDLVSEGRSLSDAHKEFPNVFPPIYTNMIAAAERSGALPTVLRRLSDFIFYTIEIRRKLVGALSYPAFMLVVTIAITIFLFVNILPKITKALASLRVTLPWYTVWVNNISQFLQLYWMWGILLMLLAVVGLLAWKNTPQGRYKFDKFMYTAPLFGELIQRIGLSRFSKTLSTVLSSGVRIVEGLNLTRNVVGSAILEEALDKAITHVQDGDKLTIALEKTGVFPALVLHMLRTGEKTGRIEEMLTYIAEVYDDEVDDKISTTTRALQPIMIIIIAGIVGLVVMSVMGPMMQAMQSIK